MLLNILIIGLGIISISLCVIGYYLGSQIHNPK